MGGEGIGPHLASFYNILFLNDKKIPLRFYKKELWEPSILFFWYICRILYNTRYNQNQNWVHTHTPIPLSARKHYGFSFPLIIEDFDSRKRSLQMKYWIRAPVLTAICFFCYQL